MNKRTENLFFFEDEIQKNKLVPRSALARECILGFILCFALVALFTLALFL